MDAHLPSPLYNSYVCALVHQWFPTVNLVNLYPDKPGSGGPRKIDPIADGSIVFLDDEYFRNRETRCLDIFKHNKNILLLSQDINFTQFLRNHGHIVVHEPSFLALDDAISMRYLEHAPVKDKFTGEYNFLCLNRRRCRYRLHLLYQLAQHNLMTQGYVTYHDLGPKTSNKFHHEHLRQDDLSHYTATLTGVEKHNHLINNVWCSSNVRNYLHIREKFTGHTMVTSETSYIDFATEKSFIALFCKKMPMIFSPRPTISMLQNEGFDCFTDIIDQSYDNEATWEKKITRGIAANRDLLASDMRHKKDEIDHRTQRNYEHLVTHWLDRRLDMLKHNISGWLDS